MTPTLSLDDLVARTTDLPTLPAAAIAVMREAESSTASAQSVARILQQDQLVRIELEILKLDSDARAKRAEKRVDEGKLAKIDELEKELKARPVFRAVEKNLDVAFVPYTQLERVRAGALVYQCTWGLFNCHAVGRVGELVPGEVILPDPWGSPARGQYAILELTDHEAARVKTLRVR